MIRITDTDGDVLLLTPDLMSIVSAGRAAMPSSLNGDDTYGIDIDLPGSDVVDEEDVGIIAMSFVINIDLYLIHTNFYNQMYANSFCMNDTFTFYTRNESTGVMTPWTPVKTAGSEDACVAAYPVAFWDKMGETTFTEVRIFAATCYIVYDQSAGAYIKVYSIYTQGVENVDYAVYVRKYLA